MLMSSATSPAMSTLLHDSKTRLGIIARRSPLDISSVATTPISEHEPLRPIVIYKNMLRIGL